MDEPMETIVLRNFLRGDMKSLKLALFAVLVTGCVQVSTPTFEDSTQAVNAASPTTMVVPSTSQTAALLPTDTPTPIPTLQAEQANVKFLELLSDNGGCQLPCLWNITPGESSYQETQATLSPLSGISGDLAGFLTEGIVISPNYTEDDLILSTIVSFNMESIFGNQVVNRIFFRARGFDEDENFVYDSILFAERLRLYMLPAVLSEQGIPAAVMVSTYEGSDRGKHLPGFDVVLLYPDRGIMAIYTTSRQLIGRNVRSCLASAHVEIHLSPVGQPDAFVEMLEQTHQWGFLWPDPQDGPYWKHIETATSMTLEEFYEVFRQPTDRCIETPIDVWPTPDN